MEQAPSVPQNTLRQGVLGVGAVTFFVVSAAGPMVAVAGGTPIGMLFGNGPGIPAAYLAATLVLIIFAVGYTAMARHIRNAGAFYAFAAQGLGPAAGGAAAMLALLAYNTVQIGIYGMFGHAASVLLRTLTGLDTPWWLSAFAAMAVIAVCGYRQIDVSARILGVLVVAEYLCVLALDLLILAHGGQGGVHLQPFTPAAFMSGSPAIGLLFCFAAFVGFEATTIYAEEAKRPEVTIPVATYASVGLIGAFYAFTTWCMVLGVGSDRLVPTLRALADPTRLLFDLSDRYAGGGLTLVLSVLFVTSVFAGLLAFHNAVARYVFALGRDRLLPRAMGSTHPVHRSPHLGSLTQTALACLVVAAFAFARADPVLTLFSWLTNVGTLGIIALMTLASFSVPAFFHRHREHRSAPLATVVMPVVAGLALAAVLALGVVNFDLLTGASKAVARLLTASLGLAALVGAGLGFASHRRNGARPAIAQNAAD